MVAKTSLQHHFYMYYEYDKMVDDSLDISCSNDCSMSAGGCTGKVKKEENSREFILELCSALC
jgi:hypothetical protein